MVTTFPSHANSTTYKVSLLKQPVTDSSCCWPTSSPFYLLLHRAWH